MLQRTLLIILFFGSLVFAEEIEERPADTQIATGSEVSDIPYGYYLENISPDMIKLTSSINLSKYADKRFFAGYGIYDINEEQCKFVDTGVTKKEFLTKFEHIKTFEGKSYAISRERMSVPQCIALTASFDGFMFTPESYIENDAVVGRNSDFYIDDAWIGVYRPDCSSEYQYLNSNENTKINYKNFYEELDNCNLSKLYVYKPSNSILWWKSSPEEGHKCIIEINSEDITRPVRVCAPWWRIERTYKLKAQDEVMINGVSMDMYNINQATLPMRMNTCLEYENNESNETTESAPNRNVICKTYYDINMGPQCRIDTIQSSCFVDGCNGYIKNVCSKNPIQPDTAGNMKDYTWGYIKVNGVKKRVKTKQMIRSHAYTCPASGASMGHCKSSGDVVVFPHECNPEVCAAYKKCLGDKQITQKECYNQHPCEEVYGDASQPVLSNGKLIGFRAKCGETMIVNENINKLSKTTDKCLNYKTIVEEVKEKKKCTVEASKKEYNVEATLTEEDVYATRDDCIRLNDPINAMPKFDVAFQYKNNGFFNLAIVKSYQDGEKDENITLAPNSMANDLQYLILKKSNELKTNTKDIDYGNCGDNFDPTWYKKRIGAFVKEITIGDSNETIHSGLLGVLKSKNIIPSGVCQSREILYNDYCYADSDEDSVLDFNQTACPSNRYTLTQTGECKAPTLNNYPVIAVAKDLISARALAEIMNLGSIDIGNKISFDNYDLDFLNITQKDITSKSVYVIGGSAVQGDDFIQRMKIINAENIEDSILSADSGSLTPSGTQCNEVAECLNLKVNSFYNDQREEKVCALISQEDNASDITPIPLDHKEVEYPEYKTVEGTLNTDINGFTDIYSVQEYADGKFGYASNFHFPLPKNNSVYVDEKEIFPIVEQHSIELPLQYRWQVKQRTQRTKNDEPFIQEGSYEGAMVSVDSNMVITLSVGIGMGLLFYTIGALTGPVGLIIAALILMFSSQYKWGDLTTVWEIDEVVFERYVENIYGYDLRIYNEPEGLITYTYEKFYSPTARDHEFENILIEHAAYKKSNLYWQGYEKDIVDNLMMRPCELGVCRGYPGGIKWYKFRDRKVKTTIDKKEERVIKLVNNVYIGATNTVSIFVPYLGDYVVSAYNKHDTLIGQVAIGAENFLEATASKMSYANISFANSANFIIAPGIKDGQTDGACRNDTQTEWGGGVSGIYYEKGTPEGNLCDKSDDKFIQDNYATYITVRPIKANKAFRIDMIKPMPYANRFFLVTYGKLEDRKYICYEKGEPCEVK